MDGLSHQVVYWQAGSLHLPGRSSLSLETMCIQMVQSLNIPKLDRLLMLMAKGSSRSWYNSSLGKGVDVISVSSMDK